MSDFGTTDKKVALITGSSSGFGRLTAETLARRGYCVYASMRNVDGKNSGAAAEILDLAKRENLDLHVVGLDVTDEASVNSAVHAVVSEAGHIDIAVNNAGGGGMGPAESFSVEQVVQQFDQNYVGPHRVSRAVLPYMRRQKSGLIVNVTSTAGKISMPFLGHYAASKHALEALSEAYKFELVDQNIDVVIVEPGAFPTPIINKMVEPADKEVMAGYAPSMDILQKFGEGMGEIMMGPDADDPQVVADAITALAEMPAGKRPLRTVAGRVFTAPVVSEGDDPYAVRQAELLTGVGAARMLKSTMLTS